MEFVIKPEVMANTKRNRLAMLESQIADTTLNIIILQAAPTALNAADQQQLAGEISRKNKLIETYRIVEGVNENG